MQKLSARLTIAVSIFALAPFVRADVTVTTAADLVDAVPDRGEIAIAP